MLLLAAVAFAADPPCYGHRWPDRLEGDHLWVEWQDGVITENGAAAVLGNLEGAWDTYEDQGWQMPPPSIVASIQNPILGSASARCTTQACDGVPVPILEIYPGGFLGGASAHVPHHELGHAVQYAYMGSFTDSVRSWEWWMEGCATWMETLAAPETTSWAEAVTGYTARPHLALHHGATGLLDADILPHLYGTAALALYTQERWGGVEAVQQTWEIGAGSTGTPIWFPDVIGEMGIDWDTYWDGYLGAIAVNDFERGAEIPAATRVERRVGDLPAEGASTPDTQPESLGFNVIAFDAGQGRRNKALYVEVALDPGADDWHAVLVLTEGGSAVSRPVLDLVALQERADGTRYGWMSGYDGTTEVRLVVSPVLAGEDPDDDHASFPWSWTAKRVRDPGPMEPGDELRGCSQGGSGSVWALGLALLLIRSRRAPR